MVKFEIYCCSQQLGTMVVIQGQMGWIWAVREELSVKAVVQVMWLMAKEVSHSGQGTMVVVHNPMEEEEEQKLLDAVDTKARDEVEQAKQQEALVVQDCNCNQTPKRISKCEITMDVIIKYLTVQNTIFYLFIYLRSTYKSK